VEFACVAGHHCVKMGEFSIRFRPENSPEALRFFLPRAKCSRNLDEHVRIWQVDRKVADLGQDEMPHFTAAEFSVQVFALFVSRLPGDGGNFEPGSELAKLPKILADDQHTVGRVSL